MNGLRVFLILILISISSHALNLRDRFSHAQIGDFVVTEQDKNYCLLFVRQLDHEILTIDEITFSEQDLPKNFKNWQQGDFGKAYPLSWISFQFDKKTGLLEDAYNFNDRSWLEFREEEVFLKGLLNLQMTRLKDTDRKKIGPSPKENEPDLRKCWSPPLTLQGQKLDKASYEVYQGRWAEDTSLLSKCLIEMYFPQNDPSIPFPTWIEIHNGHYGFKLKGVDAGHNFRIDRVRPLPKKPLLIASGFEYKKDFLTLKVKVPRTRRQFELFAEQTLSKDRFPLSYELSYAGEKDLFFLIIPLKELKSKLEGSKSYHLLFFPEKTYDFFIKTQEAFICP